MTLDTLLKQVDEEKQTLLNFLSDIIAVDTTNPPGNEIKAVQVIEKYLDKYNIRHERFRKLENRENLLAYLGNRGKSILIGCHTDIVPAGEGWSTDPFKMVLKGNTIYGRGAADNKGQLASVFYAFTILKRVESDMANSLIFGALADEETGSDYGMSALLEAKVVKPDFAIIPDIGGEMNDIDVAEKGILNVRVLSIGKQAHGANPELGVNSVINMGKFLSKLEHYKLKAQPHKYLSDPTINPGVIKGGVAANVVPPKCECVLNIRWLPDQTEEGILSELKELAKDCGTFEFTVETRSLPHEIDDKMPIIQSIVKIAQKLGKNPRLMGMSGATVAKQLTFAGIPAVGFGPGIEEQCHMVDEHIDLNDLLCFTKFIVMLAFENL